MNRLQTELRRLYLWGHQLGVGNDSQELGLLGRDGTVRSMVLELSKPADWNALSILWRAVQADLELPAPAIAISGVDGYQLWFSLSEPVSTVDAQRFMELLRQRYLANIAPARIGMLPTSDASGLRHAGLVPARRDTTGRWSAYVAPDLAAVFADEPWLDMGPGADGQADVLSRLVSTKVEDFQAALVRLSAAVKPAVPQRSLASRQDGPHAVDAEAAAATSADSSQTPKQFLLGVMGDSTVEMHLRIQAAQALLPYF
jgi:hypothetical protein